MEIVLQNTETRYYVHRNGGWTDNRHEARLFGDGIEAMFFCLDHGIHNMEIVGEFADDRMNFTVAVTDLRLE